MWSDTTLYRYLPELHRLADEGAEGDGALRGFVEAIQPSFSTLRKYIQNFGNLRRPQTVTSQYDGTALFRLGKQVDLLGEIEQYGLDGEITASRTLVAQTARFTPGDRGKRVVLTRAGVSGNNGTFLIGAVIDTHTVILDPLVVTDAGPFRWEVRAPLNGALDETTVEVQEGDVGAITRGWVLTDGNGEYPVQGRQRFIRPTTERRFLTEKEGTDGSIDPNGRFISTAAVFSRRNVGQILSLDGDVDLQNKGYARILRIEGAVAPQIVHLGDLDTGAPLALSYQPGPFQWALYPRSLITIQSTAAPIGIVEQEGYDLEILTSVGDTITINVPSATFNVAKDVGKVIRLVSLTNFSNNRLLTITAISGSTTATAVVLSPAYPGVGSLVPESSMFWELRAPTGVGDQVQVDTHPASILRYLATDFGIEIDTQESEEIQRSWVANVTGWLDLKGTAKGYQIIGLISGFVIDVAGLFRISLDWLDLVPGYALVELRETTVGRSGVDGTFTAIGGGVVRFDAGSAVFAPSDEDRLIRIEGAAIAGNNRFYTIETYVSPQKVLLRILDNPVLPDANNGALVWNISRLYSTLPPLLPSYDEINTDALVEWLAANPPPGDFFTPDTFCWEPDFRTRVPVVLTSVTNVTPSRVWSVAFTGPGEVVAGIGSWFFDIAGARYFLESIPVEGPPGTWTAQVRTITPPVLGAAELRYQCKTQLMCSFCGAAKVLATISVGTAISLSATALERYRERILLRLRDVTPAHVELIPRFRTEISCFFGLTATIEPGHVIGVTISAPFTALYDEIPADVYGDPAFDGVSFFYTDFGLHATVETP